MPKEVWLLELISRISKIIISRRLRPEEMFQIKCGNSTYIFLMKFSEKIINISDQNLASHQKNVNNHINHVISSTNQGRLKILRGQVSNLN